MKYDISDCRFKIYVPATFTMLALLRNSDLLLRSDLILFFRIVMNVDLECCKSLMNSDMTVQAALQNIRSLSDLGPNMEVTQIRIEKILLFVLFTLLWKKKTDQSRIRGKNKKSDLGHFCLQSSSQDLNSISTEALMETETESQGHFLIEACWLEQTQEYPLAHYHMINCCEKQHLFRNNCCASRAAPNNTHTDLCFSDQNSHSDQTVPFAQIS